MATSEEVTQENVENLVKDAQYLQNEAEALQYVIEQVPYNESLPGKKSILEMLLMIDHAQLSYTRPILENAINNPRPTRLNDFEHFEDSFRMDPNKSRDIQKVLSKIIKHRAGLLNLINSISLMQWETIIYNDDEELTLYDFSKEMIYYERNMLKKIADLVRVFSQEKQTQRNLMNRMGDKNDNPK